MKRLRIGFSGAGQMAQALGAGFLRAGLVDPNLISAYEPNATVAEQFRGRVPGANLLASNRAVCEGSDVLFLAVKPQQLAKVADELRPVSRDRLVVSIAAGISLAELESMFGTDRLIRVMPNTPCLVGAGASCYSASKGATSADTEFVGNLLKSVGIAYCVDEKLLDAVTGLSGSGPAFVYVMIEALSDGGVRMGLPRDIATKLAAQTVFGAAQMVLHTGEHPAVLKDRVASPGGTTIAGLHVLEDEAVRGALISAVEAATRRAVELGKK